MKSILNLNNLVEKKTINKTKVKNHRKNFGRVYIIMYE